MDSLTQISLGAAVGDACIGRKAGHKAWIWGAVLGTLPDLDILAYPLMDIVAFTEFHRGISHSITLHIPLAILFAHAFPKLHPTTNLSKTRWGIFAFLVLFTHALLDCFTTWGTQLFWPLENSIAWENIFVIDPIYTLALLVPLIGAIILHRQEERRKKWIRRALLLSSFYLLLTLINKAYMNGVFRNALEEEALEKDSLRIETYRTRPTPLNNLLWSTIARTAEGDYLIGYHSLLAPSRPIEFRKIEGGHQHLDKLRECEDINSLIDISKGFYSVEKAKEGIIRFYDLRFGELFFWEPGQEEPVFLYRIETESEGPPHIERKEGAAKISSEDWSSFFECILKGVPAQKS